MTEPYTKEWYAELFDKSEARYCEADLDKLRDALKSAKTCLTECANIIRGEFPSFAENIIQRHIEIIDKALGR